MTQATITARQRSPYPAPAFFGVPLLLGLFAALAVFALLVFNEIRDRREQLETEGVRSLVLFHANKEAMWNRAVAYGEQAARKIADTDRNNMGNVLAEFKTLWPEAAFTVYDRAGEVIPLSGSDGNSGSVAHTVRDLVHKALVGQTTKDLTLMRGFLSLSAAVPLRTQEAKALVVSLPLDSFALETMKPLCRADLAVLLYDEISGTIIGDTGSAANTFAQSRDAGARGWPVMGRNLQGRKVPEIRLLPLGEGLAAVADPLNNANGNPLGVLLAAPLRAQALNVLSLWRIIGSLGVGAAMALLLAFVMHARGRRAAQALAGAVLDMTDAKQEAGDSWKRQSWPPVLEAALEKMSGVIREYRIRAWNAEREREGSRIKTEYDTGRGNRTEFNFERLFDTLPVGAFQAESDGRFIRVNQSFAYLLGFDSSIALLAEVSSFTEFFLYGDEIRNPLNTLVGQQGERHLVSLRRSDGKVRHFALIFSPVTSAAGDHSGIIEGFLLDRELDEKLTKANLDRDFAKRQRSSMALLLAATCRQVQAWFDQDRQSTAGNESLVDHAPGETAAEDVQERMRRMQAVRAIMGDIYQIAMTEVDAMPPVLVPVELGRFLARLCRQVLPGLHSKGVSLRCEVAEELLRRFSSPAPLLRHALQRALLTVTAPANGGWAWLSVMRDPNAPKSPGVSRVLFTVSWSAYSREPGAALPGAELFAIGEKHVIAFDAPANAEAPHDAMQVESGTMSLGSEQEVIRYLAQRMHGELLEGVFTNDMRSIQIIVPLETAAAVVEGEQTEEDASVISPSDAKSAYGIIADTRTAIDHDAMFDGLESKTIPVESAPQGLDLLVLPEIAEPVEYKEPPRDGLEILLVDDSLNNRLLFSSFLRDTSHRITETHDGQEGVEAFQRGHYDVVFMDMEMPLMDGYQATRIIRALEADKGLPPTPIVGMTTYALPEFRRQCMLSGCSDFLSKPFSKVALFSLLDAFMQLKYDRT